MDIAAPLVERGEGTGIRSGAPVRTVGAGTGEGALLVRLSRVQKRRDILSLPSTSLDLTVLACYCFLYRPAFPICPAPERDDMSLGCVICSRCWTPLAGTAQVWTAALGPERGRRRCNLEGGPASPDRHF